MSKAVDALHYFGAGSSGRDKDDAAYMKGQRREQLDYYGKFPKYRKMAQIVEDSEKYGGKKGYRVSKELTGKFKPAKKAIRKRASAK